MYGLCRNFTLFTISILFVLQGFVRFSKEGGAQRVIDALKEKNDGKIVIREVETTLRVLEGTYT